MWSVYFVDWSGCNFENGGTTEIMDVVLRFSKHIGNDLEELNTPILRLFEIIFQTDISLEIHK